MASAALPAGSASPTLDEAQLPVANHMLLIVGIMVVVNFLWLLLGAALTNAFRDARLNRAINIVFALSLLASVAFAFAG